MTSQRGGFAMGLVAGLLIGLALALGVALYITKAPVPFVNKVPQRTAEQDSAEAQRNLKWDPNAALGGRAASRPAAGAASAAPAAAPPVAPLAAASAVAAAPSASAAAKPPARDPAAILAGESTAPSRSTAKPAEPFIYFVQAGAFTRNEDAEQQRAKLAMVGQGAKISEREQAGRIVYRVRVGPFPARAEADGLQLKLQEQGIEAQIVRVEKP